MAIRNLLKFIGTTVMLCSSTASVPAQKKIPAHLEKLRSLIATIVVYDEGGRVLKAKDGFFLWPGVVIAKRDFLIGAYRVDIATADGLANPLNKIVMENQNMNLVGFSVNLLSAIREGIGSSFIGNNALTLKENEKVSLIGFSPEREVKIFPGKVTVVREVPSFGKIREIAARLPEEIDFYFVQNHQSEPKGIAFVQQIDQRTVCFAFTFRQFVELVNGYAQYLSWTLTEWNKRNQEIIVEKEDRINSNVAVLFSPAFPYLLSGNYKNAIPHLEEVLSKYPNSWQVWLCLGRCWEMARLWEAAIDAYKSALALSPDTIVTNALHRVRMKLADSHIQIGNYSEAIRIYGEIGEKEKIAETYFTWGDSTYRVGNYEEAAKIFQKAISFSKGHAEAHYKMGLIYDRLGRYHEALTAFFRAVDLKPDFAEARYQLCLLFRTEGHKKNALEQYKILKSLDKNLAKKVSVLLEK